MSIVLVNLPRHQTPISQTLPATSIRHRSSIHILRIVSRASHSLVTLQRSLQTVAIDHERATKATVSRSVTL
jgi:hypothetical protein